MRYGYWLPVFGGWLRNVDDEQMAPTWEYVKRLAQRSEQIGYDLTLVAELNLNDIKGEEAPALDAWSTAAALAAVTERLELMVAVRPTFHNPALLAKQAANIDHIGGGNRLSLNVVSSWWKDEAKKYGVHFEQHDDRYARTSEWLDVVDNMWKKTTTVSRASSIASTIAYCSPSTDPAPADDLCRRRIGGGQELDRPEMRCVCHAWRSARKNRRTHCRHEAAPPAFRPGLHDLWRRRLCDRSRHESRSRSGASPDHRRQRLGRRIQELPTMARGHATGNASLARRLLGLQPGLARRLRWDAPKAFANKSEHSKTSESICCCYSAARSWRRWNGSPSR